MAHLVSKLKKCALLSGIALGLSSRIFAAPAHNKIEVIFEDEPNAKFAGFYWAAKHGLYQRHGLDVTFIYNYKNKQPVQNLFNDNKDVTRIAFIPVLTAAISSRNQDITNICQLSSKQNIVIIKKRSTFDDKKTEINKYAYTDTALPFLPLLNGQKVINYDSGIYTRNGTSLLIYSSLANEERLDTAPDHSIETLIAGEEIISRLAAYGYNDKQEITVSPLDEFIKDLPEIPGDALYISKKELPKKSKIVSDFIRATLEGRKQAFQFKDAALRLVADVKKSQKFMMIESAERALLELSHANDAESRQLSKAVYNDITSFLQKKGVLKELYKRRMTIKLPQLDCAAEIQSTTTGFPEHTAFTNSAQFTALYGEKQ